MRAMIFDFDGTLADTFSSVVEVVESLSAEYGHRTIAPEELPAVRGMHPRELAEWIGLPWHKVPMLLARIRKEMVRNMPKVPPCQGMPAAIAGLRERGVRLGMLTSNSRQNVDLFLANHPGMRFDFISTGSGFFSKHHRLKRLLKRERLSASEVCYVGDEPRDVEAAQLLGAKTIAVSWGFATPQLLAASRPDHLIADPAELLALV